MPVKLSTTVTKIFRQQDKECNGEEDPDRKWITTWNHYLSHLKYFFR